MAKTRAKAKPRRSRSTGRPRGRPPGSSKRFDFDPQEFLKELPHLQSVQWEEVSCPYCGESFDVSVDPSFESSDRLESCQMCAKTIRIHTWAEDGQVSVDSSRH